MLLNQNVGSWFFGLCFAASTGALMLLLNHLCKQLNSALPPGQKVTLHPPMPRTIGQFFWRTNILAHSLQLLDQHRQYYPASSISKVLGLALIAALVSFAGFVLTAQ